MFHGDLCGIGCIAFSKIKSDILRCVCAADHIYFPFRQTIVSIIRAQKSSGLTCYSRTRTIDGQFRNLLDIQQCIHVVPTIACYRIIHVAVNVDRDRIGAVNDDSLRVITAQNIFAPTANRVSVLQHPVCDCRLRAYAAFRVCRRPPQGQMHSPGEQKPSCTPQALH